MKFILVIALLVVAVQAFPHPQEAEVKSYTNENIENNGYMFAYELTDGTNRRETGNPSGTGEEDGIDIKGSYGHGTPDGRKISVEYTADENGYRPKVKFE